MFGSQFTDLIDDVALPALVTLSVGDTLLCLGELYTL